MINFAENEQKLLFLSMRTTKKSKFMYVLIDLNNMFKPEIYTGKKQIAEKLNVNQQTLTKYIDSNKAIDNYIIVSCDVIKTNNKGRFK